jgi:c-di-GMP-binding flagellar brake protein YcgR
MDINKIFLINKKIEIMLINQNKFYSSRIEEIGDKMIIAMPTEKGVPIIPISGDLVVGKIITDNVPYKFTCKFIKPDKQEIPVLILSLPENIQKVQYRDFVRINCSIPVEIIYNDGQEDKITKTSTRNISGGGIEVILKDKIELGREVDIKITLPTVSIETKGKVVRTILSDKKDDIFWSGVQFTQINEKDRQKIIQYIFQQQLKHR